MEHSDEMRRCLELLDVDGVRRLWAHISPHLPQPQSDAQALVMLHRARTEARSVRFKLRAYSHRWLVDNGWPSGLPDELKPKAERIYPRFVGGVGISVNTKSDWLKPAALEIRKSMENAVEDAYAEGRTEPAFVSARMAEARLYTINKLQLGFNWKV